LLRSGVYLRPLMLGGEQQFGKRPGTEAVALVVGMAQAIWLAVSLSPLSPGTPGERVGVRGNESTRFQVSGFRSEGKNNDPLTLTLSPEYRGEGTEQRTVSPEYRGEGTEQSIQSLRDHFESILAAEIVDVVFHGRGSARLPGTSCFSLPGVDRQAMLMALDLAGIACSSGSACASGSSRPSHVLQAMGVPEWELESALRVGLSKFSTVDDVNQAIATICLQYQRLRRLQVVEKLG
jgi:cysteine sulfinate desulfinase/cysteine desulfurase-like protein